MTGPPPPRARRPTRSRHPFLAWIAAGAVALLLTVPPSSGSRASADDHSAARPAGNNVAALGILEPEGKVLRITSSTEDRVAEVLVTGADVVDAGTALVRLESHRELSAERDLIDSRLQEARNRLASATALEQAAIREAQLRLERVDALASLEIEAREANLRRARATLELHGRELARLKKLRKSQVAAQSQLDRQQLQERQAREDVAASRSELALRRARQAADRAEAKAALETARRNLEAERNRISIASIERELALANARIERTLVRAPTRGRILRVLALPGEAATPGEAILEFADTSRMTVLGEVYESDVNRVSVGDRAEIRSPALGGVLTGVVDLVGSVVRQNTVVNLDPAADADTRVVEVRIQVDQDEMASRFLNLHVDVLIFAGAGTPAPR